MEMSDEKFEQVTKKIVKLITTRDPRKHAKISQLQARRSAINIGLSERLGGRRRQMEKQKEYRCNLSPYKVGSTQSPIMPPKTQNGTLEGTKDITLCNSVNKGDKRPCSVSQDPMFIQDNEIQIQWQHIETSLAILQNLYIERANMEFWSRLEMITKGMK